MVFSFGLFNWLLLVWPLVKTFTNCTLFNTLFWLFKTCFEEHHQYRHWESPTKKHFLQPSPLIPVCEQSPRTWRRIPQQFSLPLQPSKASVMVSEVVLGDDDLALQELNLVASALVLGLHVLSASNTWLSYSSSWSSWSKSSSWSSWSKSTTLWLSRLSTTTIMELKRDRTTECFLVHKKTKCEIAPAIIGLRKMIRSALQLWWNALKSEKK